MPNWSFSASNCRCGDRPAVQQRAVAAVQVLDVEVAVDVEDSGVLAADRGRFEHDIAGGVPAENDGCPFQGESFSLDWALATPGERPCRHLLTIPRD